MDEFSLEALTAQLQAVQEKKSTVRLSERNIVELVSKLKELGFLGEEVLYTSNGLEYITTDQLKLEINNALKDAGGRLALSDMPSLVGVGMLHCERQVECIVAESNGSVIEVQGEIIASQYFDGIAVEINEMLQESGMVKIGDLAVQFALSTEMVLQVLSPRLGSTVHGQLLGNMLYTQLYVSRVKAQLRGALRSLTIPIALSNVIKVLGLEEGSVGNIVNSLVEELIKEGAVQGQLRAGGQWLPAIYGKAQQDAVMSFYTQNGWIALETIRRLGTGSDKKFISTHFPDSIMLDTAIISPTLIAQVDAEIKEAASSGTWCDVVMLLPADLTARDISIAMEKCPSVNSTEKSTEKVMVVAGTCAVSQAFINDCESRAKELGKLNAEAALKKAPTSATKHQEPAQVDVPKKLDDADDDDWDTGKGKGKKKGKGKGKGKAKGGAGGGSGAGSGKSAALAESGGDSWMSSPMFPTVTMLSEKLNAWFPDLEEGGEGALPEAVAEHILPVAVREYQDTIKAATQVKSEGRRELKELSLKSLEEGVNHLWVYSRGAELLVSDPQTMASVNKGLIRSTGCDAVDWLLRFMQLQEPNADVGEPLTPIPPAERNQLAKQLPSDMSPSALQALESLKADDPKDVLDALESAAECLGIRFKKMDKKLEKQKVAEFRAALMEQLSAEGNAANALKLALPLIFTKIHGRAISIPGRAMPALIDFLKDGMEPEDFQLLETVHSLVVDNLKAQSGQDEGSAAILQESNEKLLQHLPQLKKIAGV